MAQTFRSILKVSHEGKMELAWGVPGFEFQVSNFHSPKPPDWQERPKAGNTR